jgi:NCAIR mutase (PurE)-related protein
MNRDLLLSLLQDVQSGAVPANAALEQLAHFPFHDTGSARIDTQRGLRQGNPEVVFGPGKTVAQIVEVVRALSDTGESVLVTRVEQEVGRSVAAEIPEIDYDEVARLLWLGPAEVPMVGKGTIVVAGMEGALPSVVGGLVDKPVIAVPTSVGYGASLGGIAALLGMLTSCSSNVTVVNIDNGFGAANVATLINRL